MLKGLSHLLENQRLVWGMVEQRHGFLARIPIKLPFNINRPLDVWASWRKVSRAIRWRCRFSPNLPLDCFQPPRNVSCVACSIIEVFLKWQKWNALLCQWHANGFITQHASMTWKYHENDDNEYYIAFLGIWILEGREQHHYPKSILFSDCFSGEVPERIY